MLRVPRKKGATAASGKAIPPVDDRNRREARQKEMGGGHMNRHDEIAVMQAWNAWLGGRVVEDQTYVEFFDEQIRDRPEFSGLHVFEVLDVLLNTAEPSHRESA
jgi:hypothetical protein